MEEWKKTEKRTEAREGPDGEVTDVEVTPENSTALEPEDAESDELVDDPVGATIVRNDEAIERRED